MTNIFRKIVDASHDLRRGGEATRRDYQAWFDWAYDFLPRLYAPEMYDYLWHLVTYTLSGAYSTGYKDVAERMGGRHPDYNPDAPCQIIPELTLSTGSGWLLEYWPRGYFFEEEDVVVLRQGEGSTQRIVIQACNLQGLISNIESMASYIGDKGG